jgi:hypothetical protein
MRSKTLPTLFAAALVTAGLATGGRAQPLASGAALTPELREALNRITADSLRGHLSFLASDQLEGRGTPSKGLDIAAVYIAAQFRRAGLEPVGDDGYFQTADWNYLAPDPGIFSCAVKAGDESFAIGETQVSGFLAKAVDLPPTPVVKVDASDPNAVGALDAEAVAGKVVVAEVPHPYKAATRDQIAGINRARIAFLRRMEELKPALVVDIDGDAEGAYGLREDVQTGRRRRSFADPLRVTLHGPALAKAFAAWPAGDTGATVRLKAGAPKERTTRVRNVVGLLRGSDPELSKTFVLVTAHYDHLGTGPHNGSGDRIYNGANDDGSGTASVIEIASALAGLKPGPKRSILFATFYGEEHGLVGSRHYVAHPVEPLATTVAVVNIEQVGRTDDSDGPRVSAANVTGFDYSDVGESLRRAGEVVGIAVSKHPTKSDSFFGASDNASFARAGIPAHTISVAYIFPDYHGADDEWERIDYANMAKIDRMAALGVVSIADSPRPPRWNESNPKAAPYRKAAAGR